MCLSLSAPPPPPPGIENISVIGRVSDGRERPDIGGKIHERLFKKHGESLVKREAQREVLTVETPQYGFFSGCTGSHSKKKKYRKNVPVQCKR